MTKTIKGYIAGSIFDSSLIQSRLELGAKLRSLSNDHVVLQVFNPIEDEKNTTRRYENGPKELFKFNNKHLDESDFVVLDLSDHNSQTLLEFGRITTLIDKVNPNLKLYVLWRIKLNNEDFQYSINRYIRGAVEKYSNYYANEEEIISQIKKDFNL